MNVIGSDYQAEARWLGPFVENWTGAEGMLIIGGVGVGKSWMASGIMNSLLQFNCKSATWANVPGLFLQIQLEKMGENMHALIAKLQEPELLILDDLGAEKPSEWTESVLYNVIAARYSRKASVVVTANCPLKKLEERIGLRSLDRLLAFCGGKPTILDGPTKRWTRNI